MNISIKKINLISPWNLLYDVKNLLKIEFDLIILVLISLQWILGLFFFLGNYDFIIIKVIVLI